MQSQRHAECVYVRLCGSEGLVQIPTFKRHRFYNLFLNVIFCLFHMCDTCLKKRKENPDKLSNSYSVIQTAFPVPLYCRWGTVRNIYCTFHFREIYFDKCSLPCQNYIRYAMTLSEYSENYNTFRTVFRKFINLMFDYIKEKFKRDTTIRTK